MRVAANVLALGYALLSSTAAMAAQWDISRISTNFDLVSMPDKALAERRIAPIRMGDVVLSSGRIIAVDPLTLFGAQPFTRRVAPGRYPVTVYQALQRIAGASMRFAEGKPVRWELALVNGQKASDLKDDLFYGYPVDAGLGSFMDADTMALIDERIKQIQIEKGSQDYNYYDDVLASELTANGEKFTLHQPVAGKPGNIAIFWSGWGDGVYPTFWGLDKDGKPLVLFTDFMIIAHADGSKEK